jgi:hypothetical protein
LNARWAALKWPESALADIQAKAAPPPAIQFDLLAWAASAGVDQIELDEPTKRVPINGQLRAASGADDRT